MSTIGRLQDALHDLWFGYEDSQGTFYPGTLTDFAIANPAKSRALVNETVDLLLTLGWSQSSSR